MSAAAVRAVEHLLRRIKRDPRLAYYFGHTESLELLTAAAAEAAGMDANCFRQAYHANLKFEAPAGKYDSDLADLLQSALDNIQGIADGVDIPSTAIREQGRDLLTSWRRR